jgi:ornithine cyclodeaminase/alanine dehydrogenase-like protein (mu-crystallin family)
MATAVGSVERAVAGADIVLTATPAREPLVTGADLADHALIVATAEHEQVGTLLDFAG